MAADEDRPAAFPGADIQPSLPNSESKYELLFEKMEQGFCLLERLPGVSGEPSNYRYVEVNRAFKRETGLHDAVGKSIREVAPNVEAHLLDSFDKVEANQRSERLEAYVASLGIWVEGTVFPAHAPGQIAVLFSNVSARKRAELALRESETRQRTLLEGHAQAFWETDSQGRVIDDSPSWRAWTGQTHEAWIAQKWHLAIHPADRTRVLQAWQVALATKATFNAELRLRRADDTWCWTNVRAAPVLDSDGSVLKWVGMTVDISQQKHVEENLRRSEERLHKIFSQASTGMVETDVNGQMTMVNRKFCEMLGYTEGELLAMNVTDVTAAESLPSTIAAVQALACGGPDAVLEKRYLRKDGGYMWAQSSVSALRGPDGQFQGLVAIVVDIGERKQAQERLRHASLHDPLTGLPNRTMLFEYAGYQLPHNRRHHRRTALLFLDLDRFKPVNDSHGHEVGDAVLQEAARRLMASVREEDMVARLGGDEFVILLQDTGDPQYAAEVAWHIASRIAEPFHVGELALSVSTSIGISIFPQDGDDIDTLLSHADMAMYQAKQNGRNNVQFFCPSHAVVAQAQMAIERKLKDAVRGNAFHLHYQPIFELGSRRVVSVEALLRWNAADIGPDRFIPVAESTGMINSIGKWLLREAARQSRSWREAGLPPVPISVNVSVIEFREQGFARRLLGMLAEEGLKPDAIQVEVTETAIMENIDHAAAVLFELKQAGVKILLDDFGTGYSSLAYLVKLPLNKLKIDKTFILPSPHSSASQAVTNAMVALGRALGLEVVAEGVESEGLLDFVQGQGCHQAQGFHLAPPMSGAAFCEWYLDGHARQADLH
ncbi:EAL domain-containing protein [Noviherbaspirillum galbum]|uniref:EAL domain-containing protein n=1 Tax=Noviherbaspirillum galbum TaxID=2709383 RepID=A0A6B3SNS6_9BURK|nr:EAL domain-containing protein [Noviherbaspirillum galbum]NEX62371.1 EAL domain-containing protein [Noviherbaspirillum galbum]